MTGSSRRLLGRSEVAYLSALGDAARTAPTKRERQRAREHAVRAAQRRRLDGVSWPLLAQALGISPRTLRRWRRESGDAKPPASALILTLGQAQLSLRYQAQEPLRPERQLINQYSSQSETINASIMSVRLETASHALDSAGPLQLILPAEPSRQERGVLLLGGHAQGGFRFGREAAAARRAVTSRSVAFYYEPYVELVQISHLIDKHAPLLLHISAHAAFDGPWLSSDQDEPLAVSWPALRKAVTRANARPALAVLNVCDSTDAGALARDGVRFVITCNGTVNDDAARLFTRAFYSSLIRRSIRSSFDDACAALASHYPQAGDRYELQHSGSDMVLFS